VGFGAVSEMLQSSPLRWRSSGFVTPGMSKRADLAIRFLRGLRCKSPHPNSSDAQFCLGVGFGRRAFACGIPPSEEAPAVGGAYSRWQ
jgi:hypothetical protein